MNISLNKYKRRTKFIAIAYGIISFIAVLFSSMVAIDTFSQPSPVIETSAEAKVIRFKESPLLNVIRRFDKVKDAPVMLISSAHSPLTNNSISMGYRQLLLDKSGRWEETFTLPKNILGVWCTDSYITYRYRFSLREHQLKLKELCEDTTAWDKLKTTL